MLFASKNLQYMALTLWWTLGVWRCDVTSNTAEIFLSPDEIPRWRRRSRRFSSFQITHAAMIWQLSAKKNFFSSKKVISFCLKRENFGPRFPFNPHPDLIAERYNLTLPPFSGHRKMATWVWMHKPRDSSFKKFLQFTVQREIHTVT